MTLRDKELEDRIEEVGNKLTTPPSDVQQLLQLLDKAENFLSRVEQCPPQSMHVALNPSMKALVTRDLLRHSDLDVKIAVASCLSEITRITAPDAPYDDDLMKEIFALIVGAFKNLDELSSRSFSKRVSILETVAKVRSCVLMLDLECDDLILDMFHHFLKTIRPKHSDTVLSSMETVMSLVIEESENISAKLLSCLLDNLKIDEKNIMSSAKKLAEKVLANCAVKLNPYLVEAFKGPCAPLSDYSKIVAAVCQGNVGTFMQNEINSIGETQADDSKLSDRTLCDELPQGSAKQVHEVLGKSVADADGSSKLLMSNGTFQMGNGNSTASEQKAEFSQSDVQLKDIDGSRLGDSDNLGSGATKLDSGLNLSTRKGRKKKALVKLANDHKQIDGEKEAPAITGRRKGRSKDADLSQVDGFLFKEEETAAGSKPKKKNKVEPTSGLADASSPVFEHSLNEHDEIHSRKGRSSRSKKTSGKRKAADKAAVDGSASASGHGGLRESSQTSSGNFPRKELSSKKTDVISESERNLSKCSASKSHAHVEDSKTTPTVTGDSETKLQRHRGRSGSQREVKEVDFSVEKQSTGTKRQKGGGLRVDEEDKEVKLKELVSSRKSTLKESIEDQSLLKDISESKSRRKHAGAAQAVTIETPKRRKSNEKLIGEKIRVWWPDDERFYDGVVDSFDRSTKKHKILYDDGDVEVLLLKNEKWEFIEAETKTGGVQENNTSDINASDMSKKSKSRRGDAASDKSKSDLVMSSSPDSTIKTESNVTHSKRKRRSSVEVLGDETPKQSGKGRGKSTKRDPEKRHKHNNRLTETANKSDSEKLAQSIKPDQSKSVDKVGNDKSNDSPKVRRKLKGESSRSSVKPKNASPKSRKKSRDAHDSGVKSKDEESPRTKSSTEGRQKPGGRPVKGSSRKAQGSSAPRISRNLNANDTPKSDQPKAEVAEARSTSGKKRKRGKLGR